MAPTTGLAESFLGAIQASLSVLLVIFYGGVAARLGLLDGRSTKAISKVCVRLFLPALLVVKIGSELQAESAGRYGIVLLWALVCHLVSFGLGLVAQLALGMPDWTTVAVMFNNTTSYPLLLIAALDGTGILESLTLAGESTAEAISRANSYFLVFATVSSCLTFAVGPRLIDTEHAPEDFKEADANAHEDQQAAVEEGGVDERTALLDSGPATSSIAHFSFAPARKRSIPAVLSEEAPRSVSSRRASIVPESRWQRLGPRTRWWLLFLCDFFNAPLIGALAGAVIGLAPPLHHAFFSDTADGGIFTAWLTASLRNVGSLFVPLPVVVAGVSLYTAMMEARERGPLAAAVPWLTVSFIVLVRFVVWPVISIASIYGLIARTDLLGPDPMLWFAMMLMPTGPPAMKLITLVQVSNSDPEDESSMAKILTVSEPLRARRCVLHTLTIGPFLDFLSRVPDTVLHGGRKSESKPSRHLIGASGHCSAPLEVLCCLFSIS